MYEMKNQRECFFDDHLIDQEKTTAELLLHHPIRKEAAMLHDAPWEGDGCDYHNFFYDDNEGIYRMYYTGWHSSNEHEIVICYAQSRDGMVWEKPSLGICTFQGYRENNIIFDKSMAFDSEVDNFMVFRDTNPDCAPDKRYKAVTRLTKDDQLGLYSYYSKDGIHFFYGELLTTEGLFDSLNIVFWDETARVYRCYCRGFHAPGQQDVSESSEENIRDIRYMESKDFLHWSKPMMIDFSDDEEVALYTSVVQCYPRAEHQLIGFPTRYLFRREWTKNYDELCGSEKRKERMKKESRFGMVITDCIFMTSRDGVHFRRYNEAFLRPGAENGSNWVYGDGYPARGFIETASDVEGADPELSMYVPIGSWTNHPARLDRYVIRCDGFVSVHAGAEERILTTKPFTYQGDKLYINFSTSALGYLYLTLIDENGTRYESCETFGDRIHRRVHFGEGVLEKLSGKPVTLEVRMRDADFYSMIFQA